jgi:hypothetical protein
VARVLRALDGELLRERRCLFGGGTAIALRYGEYRESVDIDFLVSDLPAYRQLRQALTGREGLASVTRPGAEPLNPIGELRADQYGIRTRVRVDDQPIKFEIVFEARIVRRDLGRAIDRMRQRTGCLERCMQLMGMTVPQAQVWQRIRALRRVLG